MKEEYGYYKKFKDSETIMYNYRVDERIARENLVMALTIYREDITLTPVIARGGVLVGYLIDNTLYECVHIIDSYEKLKTFVKDHDIKIKI